MADQLTSDDIELILTSLEFTRTAFENTSYPTYQLRQNQLQRVNSALDKMRHLRDQLKANDTRGSEASR